MTTTIGLVANIYNEVNALPGWLETHAPFFDDIRVLHTGPGGEYSSDGTIELLEKWGIPVVFGSIDEGFGAVRTRAIRMSPCDWVMVLDADERFYHTHRFLSCTGTETPQAEVDWILQSYDYRGVNLPNWENIARLGDRLQVLAGQVYDQGAWLRALIEGSAADGEEEFDAVATVRRHWHDFSFRRPTQNWQINPDLQLRTVRNVDRIHFDAGTRMHERLVGVRQVFRPSTPHGPYFDHFHFSMKRLEPEQRRHDIAIYDSIHEGRRPPTWEQFRGVYD